METIKVNMAPNPLDVQTIHASQNDGEARQWGFELHNNGDAIDSSEITDQMVFKAYKGGTEQILPENGSTPTTSPFLGDIRYPQGLLSDQEFLYRESPTEEDGLAKVNSIKGNTLVWNQLIEKGNMTDGWTFSNSTGSYANNILTFTASAQGGFVRPNNPQSIVANHKYLAMVDVKGASAFTSTINFTSRDLITANITTNWQTFSLVFTNTITEGNFFPRVYDYRRSDWDAIQIRNCMLFDLTQMGLDISSPSDFTSLFPLSYYAYNQGSLLSFNGNGIKTVGFNQWDEEWESGRINADGTKAPSSTYIRSKNYIHIFPNTTYYRKSPNNIQPFYYDGNMNLISYGLWGANSTFVTPNNAEYMLFHIDPTYGTTYKNDICINISNTESNGTYEPYTSSTLSLPISTYFPNGMKSAGTVYDELTETKAITRIGSVDLGTLTYTYTQPSLRFQAQMPSNYKIPTSVNDRENMICAKYSTNPNPLLGNGEEGITGYQNSNKVFISDQSTTDPAVFKTMMSGVYLYYELATPTETSFTTASLVTENAEIPLSNEDGVLIGKCTEQLSNESGFFDAKIKLADDDGECYSNKIQLHVERSPQ